MIKKTLFITVILFVTYTLYIAWFKPSWDTAQNQWQENLIKAQRYIYDNNDPKQNVIAGSSLANRFDMKMLPDMYNLSMNGGSLFEGLYIIMRKDKLPKNVFIEMNYVLRKENKDFISSFSSPIIVYARKVVPSLRVENQPLGIVEKIIVSVKGRFIPKLKSLILTILINLKSIWGIKINHTINTDTISNNRSIDSNELYNSMLNFQIVSYSKYPDPQLLSECFTSLKTYVNALEQKGVTIVFFEMPVNGKLCNLPMATTIRETFYKYFPADHYHYIRIPDCSEYKTMDGEHLSPDEVIKYTDYFKIKSAESLINEKETYK